MPATRTITAVLATAAAVALAAGCDNPKESDVTKDEAVARVAERAQQALQHLPPGATLKQRSHLTDIECDAGGDSTFVETSYDVVHDENWPVDSSMAQLADWWTGNGYKIVRDGRDSARHPELVVENEADSFRISYLISQGSRGTVLASLSSSSPCIAS